ncbi:trehalase family glycosidase [Virgisporangium ochraceum]
MTAPSRLTFSVQDIPFSRAGSWFGISPVVAEKTYADDLHLVSHQTGLHPVLRLVPRDGAGTVAATVAATPAALSWTGADGCAEVAYETTDTVRLRGRGLGMAVSAAASTQTPFDGTYLYRDPVDGAYVFTHYGTGRRYRVTVLSGEVDATGLEALGTAERVVVVAGTRPWELAVEEYDGARPPYRADLPFDRVVQAVADEFDAFVDAVAPWRTAGTSAAGLAAYVLWSATVAPAGFLRRPAVLMSKHWMDKVWSWDHCFNALALADGRPDLAWHQFRLVFDHQDPAGAVPDSITHSEVLYNFVKPPVHGWALRRLRRQLPAVDTDELRTTYTSLARWTGFWLSHRRAPGEVLPHYTHGNDSGWDNATTFDAHRVVQSADLAAFLVLQLRELADLATALGLADEASHWTVTADRVRAAMLETLWTGDRFAARRPGTTTTWTGESLLDCMAIALGDELPPAVSDALAARIRTHLTAFGPATQHPDSPRYEPDGYWRGPIWAPSTLLVEDGLRRAGHVRLADDISDRFRALCERSGFAENFDALTGAGLRDRAYTWTASVYLVLAADHVRRSATDVP